MMEKEVELYGLYRKALSVVNKNELAEWKRALESVGATSLANDDAKLRETIVYMHWLNPICGACGKKGNDTKLEPCEFCGLEFYCSRECEETHWERGGHSHVCARDDAPFDAAASPYRPALLRVEPPTNKDV